MAAAPRGLGKGLGALIPTEATASSPTASNPTAARSPAPQAQTPVTYLELPIDSIAPNSYSQLWCVKLKPVPIN